MAVTYAKPYIYTTMHEFKSNIAKYVRILENPEYRGVIVKRYNKPVGVFIPMERPEPKQPKETPAEELVQLLNAL